MHRLLVVGVLLGTTACGGGKVKSDAFDFGKVKSAIWMDRKLTTPNGEEFRHDMVLLTVGGWCRTAQSAYPDLGNAWRDVQDTIAADPSDATAICEAKREFYTQAAEVTKDLDGGFSVMTIQLRHPSKSLAEPPDIGAYDEAVFDAALPYVSTEVHLFDTNPYGHFAAAAACEDDPTFWESEAEDSLTDLQQSWTMVEGGAEASKPNPDTYEVSVDGTLEDRGGSAAGDLSVKASFDRCEVSWGGDFPEFW